MAGDRMAHVADAKRAKTGDESGRSTIAFPLEDPANAIDLARAIHNHAGLVDCEDDVGNPRLAPVVSEQITTARTTHTFD